MNDNDPFEEELRRLRPAAPPAAFQQRLLDIAAEPRGRSRDAALPAAPPFAWLAALWRPRAAAWIAASVFGLALAAAFLWHRPQPAVPAVPRAATADFVPDSITLSQEVLARYDGSIVQRPDGEVVRLICYDRVDRVILKDSRQGSIVEHREPRREIVPVHLDVY